MAVQLYTLRDHIGDDLHGTLMALVGVGAEEVELAGLYGLDAGELRRILDSAGLSAVSAHVPLVRLEQERERVLEEASVVGAGTLVVPSVPRPSNGVEADALVTRLVEVAAAVTEAGFAAAYHNHDFEFQALAGGSDLWSRILTTDLSLEPDVGWLRVAGRDPAATLSELCGRCALVHAKDVRQRTDGGWDDVPVGTGELDWPAIVSAAIAAGASRLVVELDHPSADPIDDVARSLETLRAVLAG